MFESIVAFAFNHAEASHWFFCTLILLAGLNIPISEDVVLITAGALASTCCPEMVYIQFPWLFLACWIAAWEAYWIGRLVGPKLYSIRWFSHVLNPHRIDRLHYYYNKFGFLTFMVGRFIPGGVRNCLFMSSGLGKMPFSLFILRDFPACLLSVSFLYFLGFSFGQHLDWIIYIFKKYQFYFVGILLLGIIGIFAVNKIRRAE